jgi:hypothetical protein
MLEKGINIEGTDIILKNNFFTLNIKSGLTSRAFFLFTHNLVPYRNYLFEKTKQLSKNLNKIKPQNEFRISI